jgi:hypothetical protein
MVSLTGSWVQMAAQSWLIYRLSGSATALGLATFVGLGPILLFAPLGGLVADRVETRRLLLVTQTLATVLALAMGWLTLSGRIRLWEVLVIAFQLGLVNAFDNPGRQVLVGESVPKDDLVNAITCISTLVNAARVLGPSIAGLLIVGGGEGWCFIFNGVSYLTVIAALLRMGPGPHKGSVAAPGSIRGQIFRGFSCAGGCRPIRNLMLLLGWLSLFATVQSVLLPIFAGRILHGGPRCLGLLMAASGVGALVGGLALGQSRQRDRLPAWAAGATMLFGACLIGFAASRSLPVSILFLLPAGLSFVVATSSINSNIQMLVADEFRGRIMALYTLSFLGMVPLGGLLTGCLERWMAPQTIVLFAGAGVLLGGLGFALDLWRSRVSCFAAPWPPAAFQK